MWSGAACASAAGRSGGVAGGCVIARAVGVGGCPLSLDDREIVEVEVAGGGLGSGWGQRWGTGREAEAAQDGTDGFLRLDGCEQTHAGSTARAGEGIHGEHALERVSPGRARAAPSSPKVGVVPPPVAAGCNPGEPSAAGCTSKGDTMAKRPANVRSTATGPRSRAAGCRQPSRRWCGDLRGSVPAGALAWAQIFECRAERVGDEELIEQLAARWRDQV